MYRVGLLLLLTLDIPVALAKSKHDVPTLIGGRVASLGDFPEVVYISSSGGRCSATIVGPRVILTAAHCVDDTGDIEDVDLPLEFVFNQQVFEASCTHHPDYSRKYSYDFALCKTKQKMEVKYASISKSPVKEGDEVTLMGFGCVNPRDEDGNGADGGNDGKLRYGLAEVSIKAGRNSIGGGQYFYTLANTALCFGDSGGPSMQKILDPKREPHYVKGVNSRGNIRDRSLLSATFLPGFQRWAKAYSISKSVDICGINKKCLSEPPKPKPECRREKRRLDRYKGQVKKWLKRLYECQGSDSSTTELDRIFTDEDLQI